MTHKFIDFLSESIHKCMENLTIPQNKEDKIESELYKKLEKNYDHADRIVRWYRNAKKSGVEENELKKTFIDNLDNIKDLFKTYENYIDSLKKMKLLNKKVTIKAKDKDVQFDPVKDIDKLRRLEGFQLLVKAIGDEVHSGTSIETSEQKYAITEEDRKKIRILGFTEHVVCWCTEGYETTNKFIFQLWQNSKTLGRGDVYGDPTDQTPYCTHSKEHWDEYSEGFSKYQQFWYLCRVNLLNDQQMGVAVKTYNKALDKTHLSDKELEELNSQKEQLKEKIQNAKYKTGDLNDSSVVNIFNTMRGTGMLTIIAMNDSNGDFLDSEDDHFNKFEDLGMYGNEVYKLNKDLFTDNNAPQYYNIGGHKVGVDTRRREDDRYLVPKEDVMASIKDIEEYKTTARGDIDLTWSTWNDVGQLSSLQGCPRTVQGNFSIRHQKNLTSLEGAPDKVTGIIDLTECWGLKTLQHFPSNAGTGIQIKQCGIENLNGIPKSFKGTINIEHCSHLNSLEGIGDEIDEFRVDDCNNLKSLKGCPRHVKSFRIVSNEELENLDYAPAECQDIRIMDNDKIREHDVMTYRLWSNIQSTFRTMTNGLDKMSKDEHDQTLDHLQRLNYWYNEHKMENGGYKTEGIQLSGLFDIPADEMSKLISDQKTRYDSQDNELNERINQILNESQIEEMETSDTASNRFEVEIKDKIREFLDSQDDAKYRNLDVQHYEESDSKYHSDVYITNPENQNQIWIEVKLNRYANLGGLSFKYKEGNWTCTTAQEDNPLNQFYLGALNVNGQKFIDFCKDYLGTEDIKLPTDITDDLLDAWKKSGNITDTENETQFITDKIPLEDFGSVISRFYQTAKLEPVYYIQVADDLYIIDKDYNPLNLYTRDGNQLKSISEAYRIGRIQFRVKAMNKNGERYFAIVLDVKILSDKEHYDKEYSCSFDTTEKWPTIGKSNIKEAEEDIGGDKYKKSNELDGIKIWIDDIRQAPEGFKWFKKVTDFIEWCYQKQDLSDVALIDTDHDAGDFQQFGGDYIRIFDYLDFCGVKNVTIHIHSANPVGADNIRRIITKNKENGWREVRN